MKRLSLKFLLAALLIAWTGLTAHADGVLSVGGLTDLAASAAKAAKLGTAIDLNGAASAVPYLGFQPRWGGSPLSQNLELGLGGSINGQGVTKLFIAPTLDISWLINKWFVAPFSLPTIWAGPYVLAPLPGQTWTWTGSVGGLVSIKL